MSFGDVIRSASSPGGDPSGIGGDAATIWHCDFYTANRLFELSTFDLSVVRNVSSPSTAPSGIGGDTTTIWHCDYDSDLIYELNTSDLSVVRSASSPSTVPEGIGGDATTIWHCDYNSGRIYELNTSDLSVIRYETSSSPEGIGGDATTIWHCKYAGAIYKLSTTDFSSIISASSPSGKPMGIGGDDTTIWHCDYYIDKIYELDATSVYTLSGTISDEWGNTIRDADITISNGTTYTTATDENGAYSQAVAPDTYNIDVSKSRSTFNDITESITISSDTTRNITMTTDKIVSRQHTQGMSIIGGISLGRS